MFPAIIPEKLPEKSLEERRPRLIACRIKQIRNFKLILS